MPRQISAYVLLGFGIFASVGSMQLRWIRVLHVSRSDRFDAEIATSGIGWIGIYLVATLTLAAVTLATMLTTDRSQSALRVVGSGIGVCLGGFVVIGPTMLARDALDGAVDVEPDIGLGVALAAIAAYLVSIWIHPRRSRPAMANPRLRRRHRNLSLLLLSAGLAMMLISTYLPWWRTVYTDEVQQVDGSVGAARVFPFWFVPVGLTVMSLATIGSTQRVARLLSLVLGCSILLLCGDITGIYWFFAAGDAISKERGMTATHPGTGLILALGSLLLLALAGTPVQRSAGELRPGSGAAGS